MNQKTLFLSLLALGFFLFTSRVFPHAAHWGPALAIVLWSGIIGRAHPLGWLIPTLAWLASDYFLGFYQGALFNYFALLLLMGVGALIARWTSSQKMGRQAGFFVGGGALSATLFYIVSNFGVWFFQAPQCQPMNMGGLAQCYALGLPFYWPSLLSTSAWMLGFAVIHVSLASKAPWKLKNA